MTLAELDSAFFLFAVAEAMTSGGQMGGKRKFAAGWCLNSDLVEANIGSSEKPGELCEKQTLASVPVFSGFDVTVEKNALPIGK